MDGEVVQNALMAVFSAGGAGGGAWIAVKIHVSHIRDRLANHHKGLDTVQRRVNELDRRVTTMEARQ